MTSFIRPLTQQVYDSLMMDVWPSMAACVDFGLDGEDSQRRSRLYTTLSAKAKSPWKT